jgi:hypothetical protein
MCVSLLPSLPLPPPPIASIPFCQGFVFHSTGAAVFEDYSYQWISYGGLVTGVDRRLSAVRVWAPSYRTNGNSNARGFLINLGMGSGGLYDNLKNYVREQYVQKTHSGLVRA